MFFNKFAFFISKLLKIFDIHDILYKLNNIIENFNQHNANYVATIKIKGLADGEAKNYTGQNKGWKIAKGPQGHCLDS